MPQQFGLDMDLMPAGLVIGLFSVPPGGELYIYRRLEEWIKIYREELIDEHVRWHRERGFAAPERKDEYPDENPEKRRKDFIEKQFESYYEVLGFGLLGKFDLAIVLMVQDYGIVDVLAGCEWCDSFQFLYGPLVGRENRSPRDIFRRLKSNRQSCPLFGICRMELHSFLSIDHGSELLFHVADFAMSQAAAAVGPPEVNTERRPWRVENHPRTRGQVTPFLCNGWNEFGLLLQAPDYSDIMQIVMDIREASLSEMNHLRAQNLKYKSNGIEPHILSLTQHPWNGDIDPHVFNTSFTTLGFNIDLLKDIHSVYEKNKKSEDEILKRLSNPMQYCTRDIPEMSKVKGKIQTHVAISCKPGHFSKAIGETPPPYHRLPPVSLEQRDADRVSNDGRYSRRYVCAGMGDYSIPHSCHFFQPSLVHDQENNALVVYGDCHYSYQDVQPNERCSKYLDTGPTRCSYVNESNIGFYITNTASFIYAHFLRLYHFARHDHVQDPHSSNANGATQSLDLHKGVDVYKVCTEIATEIEFLRRSINESDNTRHTHPYIQKMITSSQNGFDEKDIQELADCLHDSGVPRGLVAEVQNLYSIYNSCVRTPQLFGHFIDLYPYLYGLRCSLIAGTDAKKAPKYEYERFIHQIQVAVQFYDRVFLAYFQGSYLLNEITDFNFEYKGGAQQLISALAGMQRVLLQLIESPAENGGFCFIGGAPELQHRNIFGSIIEASLPLLYQPELLIQLGHEIGHRLLYTCQYEKVREEIQSTAFGCTAEELFEDMLKVPKEIAHWAGGSIQNWSGIAPEAMLANLGRTPGSGGRFARCFLEKVQETTRLSEWIEGILSDVFSDLFMLWVLFLGDHDLYQEDFWWKFAARRSPVEHWNQRNNLSAEKIEMDTKAMVLRALLVDLYREGRQQEPTTKEVERSFTRVGRIADWPRAKRELKIPDDPLWEIRWNRAKADRTFDFLKDYCFPPRQQTPSPYRALWDLMEKNGSQIHIWLSKALLELSVYINKIFAAGADPSNVDIPAYLNECLGKRRAGKRIGNLRKKLADGEVIPFEFSPLEALPHASALRHLADLFYAYYVNLYSSAPRDELNSKTSQEMFESDKTLLLKRAPEEFTPEYNENSGHLMYDPLRGFFSLDVDFRERLFKRRAAFHLSLHDIAEKTKYWIVSEIFSRKAE